MFDAAESQKCFSEVTQNCFSVWSRGSLADRDERTPRIWNRGPKSGITSSLYFTEARNDISWTSLRTCSVTWCQLGSVSTATSTKLCPVGTIWGSRWQLTSQHPLQETRRLAWKLHLANWTVNPLGKRPWEERGMLIPTGVFGNLLLRRGCESLKS